MDPGRRWKMTTEPSRVRVRGPLAKHAVGFGDELFRQGYPPERATRHVQLLAQLSRWLERQGLGEHDLSEERVAQFLEARRADGYAETPTLRSLLRFLFLEGYISRRLGDAVPAVSVPKGFLPRGLADKVVEALLASCDTSTRAGKRDLAILTVLSRLGLRAGEVAGLQLDDLDWAHGELVVRGKGHRTERLPMPVD